VIALRPKKPKSARSPEKSGRFRFAIAPQWDAEGESTPSANLWQGGEKAWK